MVCDMSCQYVTILIFLGQQNKWMSTRVQCSKLCNSIGNIDIDADLGTATVCEAIHFSAYLQQPQSISQEEKDQYVEDIIDLLKLQDVRIYQRPWSSV